jgi:hypothetical protein
VIRRIAAALSRRAFHREYGSTGEMPVADSSRRAKRGRRDDGSQRTNTT